MRLDGGRRIRTDGDGRHRQDLALRQSRRDGDRAAAEALDADRQEVAPADSPNKHRLTALARSDRRYLCPRTPVRRQPARNAGRPRPVRLLEQPLQQRPLLGLDDRRVAGVLALAQRRVLAQALRLLWRDRPRSPAAAACARTSACRRSPARAGPSMRLLIDFAGGCPATPAGRPPAPAPAGPGWCAPAAAPSAICGTSACSRLGALGLLLRPRARRAWAAAARSPAAWPAARASSR